MRTLKQVFYRLLMLKKGFLPFRSSRIAYARQGEGDRLLVCFHGYGESSQSFSLFAHFLPPAFTIFSLDLPFHGQTEWNEGTDLKPAELWEIMTGMDSRLQDKGFRFHLLGFSMGGRIALSLFEMHPEQIEKLILLAPDGLYANFWYSIATQSRVGNRLFNTCMNNPKFFFRVLNLGKKLHLVNDSIYSFVSNNLRDHQWRMDLYKRWTIMRRFKPHPDLVIRALKRYSVPLILFYGSYDRIIKPETGKRLYEQAGALASLHILHCGHRLLQENQLAAIIQNLNL